MEWYPRKPQSYRNDTWGLTLAEHGAYCLLIDYYYQSEKPIPCDDRAIASIIGATVDEWLFVKEAVTRYFHVSNKLLTNSVCDEVIEAQLSKRSDGVRRVAKYREKKKTVTRNKRVSNASRGEERKEYNNIPNSSFDEFWIAYPNKVGKEGAYKKYLSILKAKKTTHEQIMEGVKKYSAHVAAEKTEKKFIAHPTTWLSQGRWDDELEVKQNRGSKW